MAAIRRAAYLASVELAQEKGAFPLFDRDAYLAGETIGELDAGCARRASPRHGIRNALLTSIAPTGTISLFADNVSSGLEPVFSFSYTRKVLMPDGTRRDEEVSDYAYRLFRPLKGDEAPLPDYLRRRAEPDAGRSCRHAGGGAEIRRQLDLQDHQRARPTSISSRLQGRLSAGL